MLSYKSNFYFEEILNFMKISHFSSIKFISQKSMKKGVLVIPHGFIDPFDYS